MAFYLAAYFTLHIKYILILVNIIPHESISVFWFVLVMFSLYGDEIHLLSIQKIINALESDLHFRSGS